MKKISQALSLEDLYPPFLVWSLLVVCSILVFICEMARKKKVIDINKKELKEENDITEDMEHGRKIWEIKEDPNYNIIVMEESFQDGGSV